jgi:hypothetical protein
MLGAFRTCPGRLFSAKSMRNYETDDADSLG